MAKDKVVDVETGEITPYVVEPQGLIADPEKPVVFLSDMLKEMGLSGPRVPAKELIDQQFTIIRARLFASSFAQDAHAWFCVCQDVKSKEVFTTVLGGRAVVDILDALSMKKFDSPLRVTMRWAEAGRFSGYYYLE